MIWIVLLMLLVGCALAIIWCCLRLVWLVLEFIAVTCANSVRLLLLGRSRRTASRGGA